MTMNAILNWNCQFSEMNFLKFEWMEISFLKFVVLDIDNYHCSWYFIGRLNQILTLQNRYLTEYFKRKCMQKLIYIW